MDLSRNTRWFKMNQITSIINRFLILYFLIYFLILTHPVQTRRSTLSNSASPSSSSSSSSQISGSCELALRKCSKQIACGLTLHDYRLSCKQVLYGTGKNCTDICQLAIASLLSTPEGQQYLTCDCGQNDYCRQIRARTAACNAKNGGSIISQLPPNHPLVQQAALFTNGSSAAIPTANNNNSILHPGNNNYPPFSKSGLSNSNSNSLNLNPNLPGLSTSSSSHPSSHPSSSSSGLNQGFVQQYGLAGAALYPKLSKSRHSGSNKSHSCRSVELTCRSDVHCSTVYDSYRTNCADALQGERCSSRCNNR